MSFCFFRKIINNDLSYNCSDAITNEVLKKENDNTKKSVIYTSINLGLNIFTFFINIFTMMIIYLMEKFNCFYFAYNRNNIRTSIKEKDFNPSEKAFNNINEVPAREVVVNNRTPIQENQYNNNENHIENLDVPPPVLEGANSETKI